MPAEKEHDEQPDPLSLLGVVSPPPPEVLDRARESLWLAVNAEMLAIPPDDAPRPARVSGDEPARIAAQVSGDDAARMTAQEPTRMTAQANAAESARRGARAAGQEPGHRRAGGSGRGN
jgi:hypothetical protein